MTNSGIPHQDILSRLGSISLLWNRIDYEHDAILRYYLDTTGQGDLIQYHLQSNGRDAVLKGYLKDELPPEWADYALHIVEGVSICRENRNLILHGVSHRILADSIIIERITKKLVSRKRFQIPLVVIREIEATYVAYASGLQAIIAYLTWLDDGYPPEAPPLPYKPPLPRNLEQTLPEAP